MTYSLLTYIYIGVRICEKLKTPTSDVAAYSASARGRTEQWGSTHAERENARGCRSPTASRSPGLQRVSTVTAVEMLDGWPAGPETDAPTVGPLAGLRVVDLTTSYAGPTASMYLADLGADVIKVERPHGGDDARGWGPPFVEGTSAWFASANRNKRSLALDLRSPGGLRTLHALIASADVFMQNLN